MNHVILLAFIIGLVAGLRSMSAPAITSWAAKLSALRLNGSAFHFMASLISVAIFSICAVGELIADKLPFVPKRTLPGPLLVRIASGSLCGACLAASRNAAVLPAVIAAAIGSVTGAFGGYHLRRSLTASGVPDLVIAPMEDLLAIGLAVYVTFFA